MSFARYLWHRLAGWFSKTWFDSLVVIWAVSSIVLIIIGGIFVSLVSWGLYVLIFGVAELCIPLLCFWAKELWADYKRFKQYAERRL